jgi:cell filamentation protein
MYDSTDDPYCYPGTTVLKNRRNLRSQGALDRFETAITAQRFSEPLPAGKLTEQHYQRVHRHLFRDIYSWAGQYREGVRISKGDSTFCYPEYIPNEMKKLFAGLRRDNFLKNLSAEQFAQKAASFWRTSMRFTRSAMEMDEAKSPSWRLSLSRPVILCVSAGWNRTISRRQ